jgi:hypothetical protein
MRPHPVRTGVLAALALLSALVMVLAVSGNLAQYLVSSRAYALLPWTASLGFAAFALGWGLFDHYQAPGDGNKFAVGLLLGGSLAASALLWISGGERPLVNRMVFSMFGGPMLLGFWLWIGAIVGYSWRQQRAGRRSAEGG